MASNLDGFKKGIRLILGEQVYQKKFILKTQCYFWNWAICLQMQVAGEVW